MATQQVWKRDRNTQLGKAAIIASIVVGTVLSWAYVDVRFDYVLTAPAEMNDLFVRMYPPNISYFPQIVDPIIVTIHITILGTILALIMALPVALMGADNTTFNWVTYYIGKLIISATRSVNVIIWALIFVAIYGPGALAGMFAIAVRSIGFCSKILAESFEEINPGQVEAVTATGSNRAQLFLYGVVPQIKPAFVTVSTFRWEINIRAATVIGLVGAGGIGVQLMAEINAFRWSSVLTILIVILLLVIGAELVSIYIRRLMRRTPE